ncbi:MAG: P-loop NTPase [Acidobacteria bacterium]|nr:P-loop NTPase [Acidobacteriota bacterium]
MTQPRSIILQAHDQATATHLCRALETDARVRVTAVMREPQQIAEEVARQRPALVLLMLGAQPEHTWALCRHLQQVAPETAVICASQNASPDLILDTLRNGAREFLRLPVRPEELRTVLDRILDPPATNQSLGQSLGQPLAAPSRNGRVVAVFSPRGGCGTSFIASNLAVGLNAQTVLLDLNLQASSHDLLFGLKSRFSWVDLVENRARVDDQMLASLLVNYNERLSLLAAPAQAEDAEVVTADQMRQAIAALRTRFAFVVLDVMHSFDALTLAALDEADDILLVLGPDIVAVRAAQRALTLFQRLGYPREKIKLLLNRANQHSELDLREIERALGLPMTSLISDDYRTVVASLNLGQPLLAAPQVTPLGAELQQLIAACGWPFVGQLNQSKRGLLDVILRRNTAPVATEAPPPPTTRPLNATKPLVAPTPPPEHPRTAPLRNEQDEYTAKTF